MIQHNTISIIVPLFNSQNYISSCLNSIKNQTFKNFEIIIVDDCSTDNSIDYIKKFIKQNPMLKCTYMKNKKNEGHCQARNKGIQLAQGEYICFLDSDDTYDKNYLQLLYDEILVANADFVFCGYDRILKDKIIPYVTSWCYPTHRNISKLKFEYLIGKTHICHCAILYRRSFLLQNNLQYYEGCRQSGDTEFVSRVLFATPHFSCVPLALYQYNIHENSITTQIPSEKNIDGYYAYERIQKSIKSPFWRVLFVFFKKSRKVYYLIEEFIDNHIELPFLFCSKYKILFFLFINMILKRTHKSIRIFNKFYSIYIRTR